MRVQSEGDILVGAGNKLLSADALPKTLTRDGAGNLTAISVTDGTDTWTKTLTRDGAGAISAISEWVKS